MPEKQTLQRARQDRREGKAPTTQAGEFIREEMHHIREGKHGARSTKQDRDWLVQLGAGANSPPAKGKASRRLSAYGASGA